MILFLFLSHLGLGIVFTLLFVAREAGVKFFRFNAGLAAILIAVGFAFRPASGDAGNLARASLVSLGLAEAATIVYWATVGRTLASVRPVIVWTARIAGVVAIVAQALTTAAGRPVATQALTVASFLS